MDRFTRAIVSHPWVVIGVVSVITAFFAFFGRHVRIDSSIGTLIDPADPAVAYYEEIRQIFGSDEIDIVFLVADDIFTPASLTKIKDLSERLAAIPGVANVSSLATEQGLTVSADGDIDTSVVMKEVPADPAGISRLRSAVY